VFENRLRRVWFGFQKAAFEKEIALLKHFPDSIVGCPM
jgi:hypothetical protein